MSTSAFLRTLQLAERPPTDVLARVRAAREAADAQLVEGGVSSQPETTYEPERCRLRIFTTPDSTSDKYTPIFQISPLPSSVFHDGSFYILGGMGEGSCFYDSICFLLNVNGYADAFRSQDQTKMRSIVGEFRCSFTRGMTTRDWREFLRRETQETPHSRTWAGVAQERMSDTKDDIEKDFCDSDVWATEATARYIARTLNITIYVIDKESWSAFCGVDGINDDNYVIVISWERKSHFSPIVQIEGISQDGNMLIRGIISDAETKARIKQRYNELCACSQAGSPCYRPLMR